MGAVHGDAVRNITGRVNVFSGMPSGAFVLGSNVGSYNANNSTTSHIYVNFDSSRVVPVAAKNQPRAWGSLACVYLGVPAS